MSQESDNEPEVKVIDKRRFSSEGDAQNTGTAEESRRFTDASQVPDGSRGPAAGSGLASGSANVAKQPARSEPTAGTTHANKPNNAPPSEQAMSEDEDGGTRVEFASFLMSLATQTLMMLGEIPNPETRLTSMNLGAARQTIDILDMLELKTKGNLSSEESQLFKELLPSLKMAFVEKVRGAK